MKKSITLLAVLAAPLASAKMQAPTVYGKINKVLAYTDQEDVHARKTMDGLTDVHNSETRLGAKGKVELTKSMTAKYKLELGLNSTNEGDGTQTSETSEGKYGRIRIRQAKIGLKTNFGKITMGQTYAILSKMSKVADPLDGTIAGHQGEDQAKRIANATKDVGFAYRSRVDQIAYKTPSMGGFTLAVAADRENDNENKAASKTGSGATHYEYLARFQRDMGAMDLDLYLGYSTFSEANKGDQKYMMYGANMMFGNFGLNVGLSKEEDENTTTPSVTEELDRMFAGLTYKKDKCKFALTYQTREDNNASHVKNDKIDYTQIAVNYTHSFNKYAQWSITALKWETENKTAANGSDKSFDNDATQVALGLQLKF